MATLLAYQKWGGERNFSPITLEEIGVCRESTEEVLSFLHEEYAINQYKDLYAPISFNESTSIQGLSIKEVKLPRGVSVNASIDEYVLNLERFRYERPLSRKEIHKGLRLCTRWHMKVHDGRDVPYINSREWLKEEYLEKSLLQLTEAFEIGLDIEKATPKHLSLLLNNHYFERLKIPA
jgi:hypothetical protein